MNRLGRLASVPIADLLRLAEASAVTIAVEAGLRLLAPSRCLGIARRRRAPGRSSAPVDPARLAWLVEIADRYLPGRSSCLRRALALSWILGRRGIAVNLRIGVARQGGRVVAHAWLERGNGLTYGAPDGPDYVCLPLPSEPTPSSG